jgi:ABC-type amino acid transport substrate-binding protein
MQKPILLGVEGQAKELVENYGIGLSYEPENKKDFLVQLKKIKKSGDLYSKLVANGKPFAEEFSRNGLAEEMYRIIKILYN